MFFEYGKPLHARAGTIVITMDLPGGLDGRIDNGTFTMGPIVEHQNRTHRLRLRRAQPDGTTQSCTVTMQAATVGSKGARLVGRHDGSAFDMELLHEFATETSPEAMHMSFTACDAMGAAAEATRDGALFMSSLSGADLAVAGEHGPFLPPGGIPGSATQAAAEPLMEAFELLARIQDHTPVAVLVPDLTATTMAEVYEWRQIVTLLVSGHVEDRRLGTLTANLQVPVPAHSFGRCRFTCCRVLRLTTTLQTIDLGAERLYLTDGVVEPLDGGETG